MEETAGGGGGERHARLIRDLCALLAAIISPASSGPRVGRHGMSPAAAAAMLLGASMALMLCGSVTFAIGFLLMPWVAGVAILFGFAGAVSNLSSGLLPSSSSSKAPPRGRIRSPAPDKLVAWR